MNEFNEYPTQTPEKMIKKFKYMNKVKTKKGIGIITDICSEDRFSITVEINGKEDYYMPHEVEFVDDDVYEKKLERHNLLLRITELQQEVDSFKSKSKIQIGFKSKDKNNEWMLVIDKTHNDRYSHLPLERRVFYLPLFDHPEQPEIDWKDSLQPVYIEV